eukprot:9474048-Pyramimonas_sp.AAC.1
MDILPLPDAKCCCGLLWAGWVCGHGHWRNRHFPELRRARFEDHGNGFSSQSWGLSDVLAWGLATKQLAWGTSWTLATDMDLSLPVCMYMRAEPPIVVELL